MKLLYTLLICILPLFSQMQDINIFPSNYEAKDISGITVLDTKEIYFKEHSGISFSGISALAYGKDKELYALSDKGYLFKLELNIKNKKNKLS
ncbi:hypothetical protein JHD50_02720 [Sulfurimonas sp. MAG313]|nr:hypothetical protein [Sulfurimonas sp. MAG313]MDF1880224.1 hypothetical protein [Sulfurimonas sp. MAG313]